MFWRIRLKIHCKMYLPGKRKGCIMTVVFIRKAIPEDYSAIAQIAASELHYDCPDDVAQDNLNTVLISDSDKVFVAVCDDKTVGFIHTQKYLTLYSPLLINLLGLAVRSGYQGCGVGSKLLAAAEQWATEIGAVGVRVNSGGERRDAHQFYGKRGYGLEKLQMRFIKFF